MPTILGIDPSLARTAIAVIQPGLVTLRDLPTKGTKGDTLTDRLARLQQIRAFADAVYDDATELGHQPADLVVIEGPSLGQRAQAGTHDRAGLWWLLIEEFVGVGAPVAIVPPTCRAMYATGKGNAGKDEVMLAVAKRYAHITDDVTNNDRADALVLAAMGARHLGHPIDDVPQAHLRALAKVAWPAVGAGVAS